MTSLGELAPIPGSVPVVSPDPGVADTLRRLAADGAELEVRKFDAVWVIRESH